MPLELPVRDPPDQTEPVAIPALYSDSTPVQGDTVFGARGTGSCPGHHGELLQGAFADRDGHHLALLTLPLRSIGSRADITLGTAQAPLTVSPDWKLRSKRAAELALTAAGLEVGGLLSITSSVPPSLGLGSSTSDVIATVRACFDAAGKHASDTTVARIAVAAETASDGTMFPAPVLFAHREGRVLETFGFEFPEIQVLGFSTASLGRENVDTLMLPPPEYTTRELEQFRVLRGLARGALKRGDLGEVGRVATASASINQRRLPFAHFADLVGLVPRFGAHGLQVAHSGSIAGFLFTPGTLTRTVIADAADALSELGVEQLWSLPCGENPNEAHRVR